MFYKPVTFTATVKRKFSVQKDIPAGLIAFTVDGNKFKQVKLEANGFKTLTTTYLKAGRTKLFPYLYLIRAYGFFSSSVGMTHVVIAENTS